MHTHIFCVNKSITIVLNCLRATEGKDGGWEMSCHCGMETINCLWLWLCPPFTRQPVNTECFTEVLVLIRLLAVCAWTRSLSRSITWHTVYLHVNVCCVHEIHGLYWRHGVFHTLLQSQKMFIQKLSIFLETLKIKLSSKPKFCGAFFRPPFLKLPKIHHFLPSAI